MFSLRVQGGPGHRSLKESLETVLRFHRRGHLKLCLCLDTNGYVNEFLVGSSIFQSRVSLRVRFITLPYYLGDLQSDPKRRELPVYKASRVDRISHPAFTGKPQAHAWILRSETKKIEPFTLNPGSPIL